MPSLKSSVESETEKPGKDKTAAPAKDKNSK
jgi:hypothetical protein